MKETSREKYEKAILSSNIQWTDEMEAELDKLEEKHGNEQSDIENDRINENGIEEGYYLNNDERKRMNELQLIQKTYYTKKQILEGKITATQKDLYNDAMNIANSKSMFDI